MPDEIKDLLLKDYEYISSLLTYNEDVGEKRLTFFNTLVAAVIGGVITLITSLDGEPSDFFSNDMILFLILLSLSCLWGIGIIVLRRLKKRNSLTDFYKEELDKLRALFIDTYGTGLLNYCEYSLPNWSHLKAERKFTSLLDIAAILNSFLLSLIVALTLYLFNGANWDNRVVLISSVSCALSVVYYFRRYFSEKEKPAITHSGGVVFKIENSVISVLLVSSKNNETELVLPKGHIEPFETMSNAAIREVLEETGIKAEIVKVIARTPRYDTTNEKNIITQYYLMKYIRQFDGISSENRKQTWCSIEDAINRATHKETKEILYKIILLKSPISVSL